MLEECAARFDWVLIDTPPVGVLPDAQVLARLVGGVILVIGAGSTPAAAVERAVAELGGPDAIIGTVLNRVEERRIPDAGYYGQYRVRRAIRRSSSTELQNISRSRLHVLDSIPVRSRFRSGQVGQAYNEAAFRHFLAVDRPRAERSQRFLYLVLVAVRQSPGRRAKLTDATAAALFRGLGASVREVDFVGWYREGTWRLPSWRKASRHPTAWRHRRSRTECSPN